MQWNYNEICSVCYGEEGVNCNVLNIKGMFPYKSDKSPYMVMENEKNVNRHGARETGV